jgi:hypothetical protein
MTAEQDRILANHERIRDTLRRLLGHLGGAHRRDLVSALALAGDLAQVVKGLEAERRDGSLGGTLDAAVDAVLETVMRTATSISYVFSVRAVLGCVADILRLLDAIERETVGPPAPRVAVS